MLDQRKERIAIIGGGPSALFVFKRLVKTRRSDLVVHIFERKQQLGVGMPYSSEGATLEHITNVSGNELPNLCQPLAEWVQALPQDTLDHYRVDGARFSEERVLPRLLFGEYLRAQFELLREKAESLGLETVVHFDSPVTDIEDLPEQRQMAVEVDGADILLFHRVVICTGHNWPKRHEGKVPGYFDSPYPPSKLARQFNHSVAIRGSSLTAIDAVRSLARQHGGFLRKSPHRLTYEAAADSPDFKLVMHSRSGLLPCVRFHLEDPQVNDDKLLPRQEWEQAKKENDGFVPLDLIFEEDFKKLLREKDAGLYERIKAMTMEEFVAAAMERRERSDPFHFFKAEYEEALESLAKRESIPWKENLAILSFALNYPAKHFSAEDMLRLKEVLLPLISIVIAFVPEGSCEELIALHHAGRLELISVGSDSDIEVDPKGQIVYRYSDDDGQERSPVYQTYVDCVGQPHLPVKAFPFPSLLEQKVVRQARLRFRSALKGRDQQQKDPDGVEQDGDGSYHLIVPGIAINDSYQPVDWEQKPHPRLHIMAVPYIAGHNPDYSGLDFCDEASLLIVDAMLGSSP